MASPSPDPIQRLAINGLGIEDPDYQVGARFEALNEGVLVAASKSTGFFFAISISQKVRCTVAKQGPKDPESAPMGLILSSN